MWQNFFPFITYQILQWDISLTKKKHKKTKFNNHTQTHTQAFNLHNGWLHVCAKVFIKYNRHFIICWSFFRQDTIRTLTHTQNQVYAILSALTKLNGFFLSFRQKWNSLERQKVNFISFLGISLYKWLWRCVCVCVCYMLVVAIENYKVISKTKKR